MHINNLLDSKCKVCFYFFITYFCTEAAKTYFSSLRDKQRRIESGTYKQHAIAAKKRSRKYRVGLISSRFLNLVHLVKPTEQIHVSVFCKPLSLN